MSKAKSSESLVTVVLPCLNEGRTVGACVREAARALESAGIRGEILVADNGSSDSSARIARSAGARVIRVEKRGYGAAVAGGISAARGKLIVMADADFSYDLAGIPLLLNRLDQKGGVVVGSRLRGTVMRGAMPVSHRFVGTPLFNVLLRIFFGVRISDSQSGMRAFARKTFTHLDLRSDGMEFATEMLAKAAKAGVEISEVPIRYRPVARGRTPHLKTFSDGWRHLRLLLLMGPPSFLLVPGLSMLAAGAAMMAASLLRFPVFGHRADVNFAVFGSGLVLAGQQIANFGLGSLLLRRRGGTGRASRLVSKALSLEGVIFPAILTALAGISVDILIFTSWVAKGFPAVSTGTTSLGIAGTTLILLAGGMVLGGFFLGSLAAGFGGGHEGRPRDGRRSSA